MSVLCGANQFEPQIGPWGRYTTLCKTVYAGVTSATGPAAGGVENKVALPFPSPLAATTSGAAVVATSALSAASAEGELAATTAAGRVAAATATAAVEVATAGSVAGAAAAAAAGTMVTCGCELSDVVG